MTTVLNPKQRFALIKSKELGLDLVVNSKIAQEYREGCTLYQLAGRYLPNQMKVSEKVAVNAIRYALQELLTKKERKLLAKNHQQNGGIKGGALTLAEKKGIHALTIEERIRAAEKGYQVGLGRCSPKIIFYASLKGLLAMGKIPYSSEEKERLIQLIKDPSYQYPVGSRLDGKPRYKVIGELLFQDFGVRRTASGLKRTYYRILNSRKE